MCSHISVSYMCSHLQFHFFIICPNDQGWYQYCIIMYHMYYIFFLNIQKTKKFPDFLSLSNTCSRIVLHSILPFHIDALVQDCGISIANALEIPYTLYFTEPSMYKINLKSQWFYQWVDIILIRLENRFSIYGHLCWETIVPVDLLKEAHKCQALMMNVWWELKLWNYVPPLRYHSNGQSIIWDEGGVCFGSQ